MKLSVSCLLMVVICSLSTPAQVLLTNWNTISSMRTIRGVSLDANNVLWCATSGGVFSYSIDSLSVREFRNINALQTLDATAIFADSGTQKIFVGASDGAFDILDQNITDGDWTNITDIKRASQYPRRGVRNFILHKNKLYISTDFGIIVFDPQRNLFIETIDRIGTLEERTRVNETIVLRDSLWCATDLGIAVAPLDAITLRLPTVWKILDSTQGIPKLPISHIQTDGTTIFFSAGNSVYRYSGDTALIENQYVSPILTLVYKAGVLSYATKDAAFVNGDPIPSKYVLLDGHSLVTSNNSILKFGFIRGAGLALYTPDSLQFVPSNTPASNQFAQIVIDTRGGLWVATDIDPGRTGLGLSYFNGEKWINYTDQSNPPIPNNNCYRVSALSDGSVVAGLWGKGALRIQPDTDGFVAYNTSNSALVGIAADPNYALVGEAALDRNGALWMVNEQSTNRLLVRTDDKSSSTFYANCNNPNDNVFRSLCIDNAGTKWVGGYFGGGLVGYNERNTPNDKTDDVCNAVKSSNSQLPDNTVIVVRTDLSGAVWIGTSKGVAVMATPGALSNSSVPFVRRISALQQVTINDIFVDAINNKWVATPLGVFVLNVDGTEVLETITTANSPLLDNNVRSIAINNTTGEAYFGTSIGCSVARTQSIKPLADVTLSFAPQPFKPSEHGQIIIDGLSADADVRILTTSGVLVAAIQAKGRQVLWNGTDIQGRVVPPGVYIVHAASATSSTQGVGKLIVTR